MKRSKEPPRIRVEHWMVHDARRRLQQVWTLLEAEARRQPPTEKTTPVTVTPATTVNLVYSARTNGGHGR